MSIHPVEMCRDDDCLQACVASLFGLDYDDVPSFTPGNWFWELGIWALHYNLFPILISREALELCSFLYDGPVIASIRRNDGNLHSVIWQWDRVLFDPAPSPQKIAQGDPTDFLVFGVAGPG